MSRILFVEGGSEKKTRKEIVQPANPFFKIDYEK